ncbi:hypothetical protein EJ06DRAFT_549975 [Trichodelitschia bisporula]|uniref:Uncharacterized protein n=1 Tax=Trichodelitschia bisporula TaxID=703511 RepID=A0A6G1HTU5_9PEZI|nr:hypothetical protein EJ06DRAFT_549975 [Trichodelitschia bisporula]
MPTEQQLNELRALIGGDFDPLILDLHNEERLRGDERRLLANTESANTAADNPTHLAIEDLGRTIAEYQAVLGRLRRILDTDRVEHKTLSFDILRNGNWKLHLSKLQTREIRRLYPGIQWVTVSPPFIVLVFRNSMLPLPNPAWIGGAPAYFTTDKKDACLDRGRQGYDSAVEGPFLTARSSEGCEDVCSQLEERGFEVRGAQSWGNFLQILFSAGPGTTKCRRLPTLFYGLPTFYKKAA